MCAMASLALLDTLSEDQLRALAGNPLALRRRKTAAGSIRRASIDRYLNQALWQAVLDAVDHLPQTTRRECQHVEPRSGISSPPMG